MTSPAEEYIAKVRWKFARTMPRWPHEYTVKDWRPEWSGEFETFCRMIARDGTVEPWPPPPDEPIYHNSYLVIGPFKYWAMGPDGDRNTPEKMTVINRCLV